MKDKSARWFAFVGIAGVLLTLALTESGHCGEPYIETYAVTGSTFSGAMNRHDGEEFWSQKRFVGAKLIARFPFRDFAVVGRGQAQGVPGRFVYKDPRTFNALLFDAGLTWTPLRFAKAEIGGIATYGGFFDPRKDVPEQRVPFWTWGAGAFLRHPESRAWVGVGVVRGDVYGPSIYPRLVLHSPQIARSVLEVNAIWGKAATFSVSINVELWSSGKGAK